MQKKNIDKIIESNDNAKMHELKDVLVCLIDSVKVYDYHQYLEYEYKIHCIVYGKHLGKDLAEHWVSCMENKDGTKGEHWTYDQVSQLMREKSIKCDPYDFYAVLNMMYSDYYNSKFDISVYVELAKDWIHDMDIDDKILKYYYYVVK